MSELKFTIDFSGKPDASIPIRIEMPKDSNTDSEGRWFTNHPGWRRIAHSREGICKVGDYLKMWRIRKQSINATSFVPNSYVEGSNYMGPNYSDSNYPVNMTKMTGYFSFLNYPMNQIDFTWTTMIIDGRSYKNRRIWWTRKI